MLFPSLKKLNNVFRLRFARPYSIMSLTIYSNANTAHAKEKQSEILRQSLAVPLASYVHRSYLILGYIF